MSNSLDEPNSPTPDSSSAPAQGNAPGPKSALLPLAVGAIGVVFGDIGTNPLYAIREVFGSGHCLALNHDNVLGVLSLMIWSLVTIVTVKYVTFMMRAANRGEGGIMALLALVLRGSTSEKVSRTFLRALGIFGAALFYGDGMITPAISGRSAIEGLEVATPLLKSYVIPLTLALITGLFTFQQMGTAKVAALFGLVMLLWFTVTAIIGGVNIALEPGVLAVLNPKYAVRFFSNNGYVGFITLGAVVLCVTGAEALYADMGHFGRTPIRVRWLYFVFPALMLNFALVRAHCCCTTRRPYSIPSSTLHRTGLCIPWSYWQPWPP